MDDCNHLRLYKWFVILLNIVIAIVGLAMVGFGFTLRFGSETPGFFYINFDTQQFVIGVTVLIVLGIILLVVAGVGHCVVCSGSRGGLRVYAPLVGVPAVLIMAIGAVTYIRSNEVGKQLAEIDRTVYLQDLNKGDPGLVNTLKLFHNAVGKQLAEYYRTIYMQYLKGDQSVVITLKLFHNLLDCCGIGGSLEPLIRDTCPNKSIFDFSTPSCPKAIADLFSANSSLILGCFVGAAIAMICTTVCSCILNKQIKRFHQPIPTYF
ncbi:CD9 antigen-like isoform X2 [Conger conger]|uniref:CD9 antigen-like isoform X2 n=1 Tax=Conger conger TaxID=82655 RepID=UPI002A5A9D5A|nr:CD9 antigen-like isoform X2 [Conger conger]